MNIDALTTLQSTTNAVARRYATLMARHAQRGFGSATTRRGGQTLRSHKAAVKEDRTDGWVYAVGVRAQAASFITNYGQGPGTKGGGRVRAHMREVRGTRVSVAGHTRRTVRGTGHINAAIASMAPRLASELARRGSTAVLKLKDELQGPRP